MGSFVYLLEGHVLVGDDEHEGPHPGFEGAGCGRHGEARDRGARAALRQLGIAG